VWRQDPPDGWLIGPDALEPYVDPAMLAVARSIAERWEREVWPRMDRAGGRGMSQVERRERAAEVFGDPVPMVDQSQGAARHGVVEERPQIWDRMLVPAGDFVAMAQGRRTFGFWYGGNVPRQGEVVVYVEHVPYRKPSAFGPSVAFELGDVDVLDESWGRPTKHVASLLPLPGITRAPIEDPWRWGCACALCGWWPRPAELVAVGARSGCWRWGDQSAALMAAAAAGMAVTLAGLVCPACLEGADDVRRGRIGYEVKEPAGAES
jgi:hypothetical protein